MPADAFHWILYLEGPIEMQISGPSQLNKVLVPIPQIT